MASRSTEEKSQRRPSVRGKNLRSQKGVLMPFLTVCVILLMGTGGMVTDLMRNFQAVRELKYAAQSTALYALSFSSNASGTYSQSSIQDAALSPTTAISNNAQTGPAQASAQWTGPVTYTPSDIAFVQNAADLNESFLQVTARRQGDSALAQFFLPLLFTGLNSSLPTSIKTFQTAQTVEVLGQPATRIGAGAPASATMDARASDFYGYAALPLAITAQQFAALVGANRGSTSFSAVADLVSSTNPGALAGHIPAAFVNLSANSGGSTCYNGAQGALAQGQLQSMLAYFSTPASSQASTIPPSWVECGSQVSAFDPADPAFTSGQNQAQIAALVNALPARIYVLPVISGAQPQLAGSKNANALNTVVGFACVQLPKQNLAAQPFSLKLNFVTAPPLRNTASAAGVASWPVGGGSLMPAPSFPFLPRTYDGTTGGVSTRLPGVALAPALSPRAI